MTPFLSFYTPTFRLITGELARPGYLARCRASVGIQSIPCEHVVVEDPVPGGAGVGGMFAQVPQHAHRLHGEYIHFLADDDVLYGPDVAAQVQARAVADGFPEVLIVRAQKSGIWYPLEPTLPPQCGRIDLGCVITRRDVWLAHVHDYAPCYEGDFHHVHALWQAGRQFVFTEILFEQGPALQGRPE